MTRQGGINILMPQLLPLSNLTDWGSKEPYPKGKEFSRARTLILYRFCWAAWAQTSHLGASHKKGLWHESLSAGALGGLVTVTGDFARKLEVTKHQCFIRQGSGPGLMDTQLWLPQAPCPQNWTWAGAAVACGNQCCSTARV